MGRSISHPAAAALIFIAAVSCRSGSAPSSGATAPARAAVASEAITPTACEALRSLTLPHVSIDVAQIVPATAGPPKARAYCHVVGTSRPAPDSVIGFELCVPLGDAWNGRYEQLGSSGFGGFLPSAGILEAVASGYAAAGTDDGHRASGDDARWAIGHPETVRDYGGRALKETSDAAHALIHALTGRAPAHSYFVGCSCGGREALIAAQRYPLDFDGIVAGAPAGNATHLFAAMAWNALALDRGGSFLSTKKLAALQAAALKTCGDAEGIVEDPTSCHFDPGSLRCPGADSDDCLTDGQLTAVRAIYDGARNPRTGERFAPGYPPGAEAEQESWDLWLTGGSREKASEALHRKLGTTFLQSMVAGDAAYDIRRFDFDRDLARADARLSPVIDARDPNLRAFGEHGKLLVFHGLSDPAIPAADSVAYYERVKATMGDPRAFYRLFLAPGMLHCGDGPGPNAIPALTAMVEWVERGVAPDSLLAARFTDDDEAKPVLRAWPVCSYPARAVWDGRGDRRKAESWRCEGGGSEGGR